jgi:hypothetical protein
MHLDFRYILQISSMSAQSGANNQPPEERYHAQLEQLTAMGFVNRDANLQGKIHWDFALCLCI